MAERKIGDLWVAGIIGLFFLGMFSAFFLQADDMHGLSNSLGTQLKGINNQSSADYHSIEQDLEDNTYNTSIFTVKDNQFIDTRGTSQDFTISKDTTSSNKGFLINMGTIIKQPFIMGTLISLLISVGIILFFRFWKPGGI